MTGTVKAECVPLPDCASIGYTATSCEEGFVRCPFDISKLLCISCDTKYEYSCSGIGQIGIGTVCNGKYAECGCSSGYEWNGTACVSACSDTCSRGSLSVTCSSPKTKKSVGTTGCGNTCYSCECPSSYDYSCSGTGYSGGNGTSCDGYYQECSCSSGYNWQAGDCVKCDTSCNVGSIFYSDGTCNTCVVDDKTPIGIVIKNDALVISQMSYSSLRWAGNDSIDVSDITNYENCAEVKTDYNGKANTLAIVSAYLDDTTSNNAAVYCNSYSTAGTNAGDWYLPAAGEIYDYVVTNSQAIWNTVDFWDWEFTSNYFWSSSELSASNAWAMMNGWGSNCSNHHNKYTNVAVVFCLLDINDI